MIRESSIEKYLTKKVTEGKGKCLKLTGYIGIPDRLVLLPGGVMIFVELKRSKHHAPRPSQLLWQRLLTRLGFTCLTVGSKEEVDQLMK